jgi:hypothetical protein
MSENILIGIFAGLFGIALEATRQYMTRGNSREEKATDDASAFRKELLDETHKLRQERDQWQNKYYDERDARLKAEWQLEALEWIREDKKYLSSEEEQRGENDESTN